MRREVATAGQRIRPLQPGDSLTALTTRAHRVVAPADWRPKVNHRSVRVALDLAAPVPGGRRR